MRFAGGWEAPSLAAGSKWVDLRWSKGGVAALLAEPRLLLRDARTGETRWAAAAPMPEVRAAVFVARDCRLLLIARTGLELWNVETGERVAELGGPVASNIAFSPDASALARVAGNEVVIEDLETGARRGAVAASVTHVRQLALDRGARAVAIMTDDAVRVADVGSGVVRADVALAGANADKLVLADDGAHVLTSSRADILSWWDLHEGTKIRSYIDDRHEAGVKQIVRVAAVSPDGRRALSGGSRGAVRLWDLEKVEPIATMYGHDRAVEALWWRAGGTTAGSLGADGTRRIWDLERGVELDDLRVTGDRTTIAIARELDLLAAHDWRSRAFRWRDDGSFAESGVPVGSLDPPPAPPFEFEEGHIEGPSSRITHAGRVHDVGIMSLLAWHEPTRRALLSSLWGEALRVVDYATGELVAAAPFGDREDAPVAGAFSPDASLVAIATLRGNLRRYAFA